MTTLTKRKALARGFLVVLLLLIFWIGSIIAWNNRSSGEEIVPEKLAAGSGPSIDGSPKPPPGMRAYTVIIDAGHGGHDPGATGASGDYERDYTLSLSRKVFELLQAEPMFEPLLTRSDDTFVELEDRAAFANEWEADAFLSIHGNTYEDSSVSGTETLYLNENSVLLAETMQRHVVEATGFRDRGVKKQQLKVLSLTEMPSALIEIGYLTNAEQEADMLSLEGQATAAQAVVDGLKRYFEIAEEPAGGNSQETGKAEEPAIENKIYYNGQASDGKRTALTFDDGPDDVVTPRILDILKENKIKATFFMLGSQAAAHPEVVRRIVDEGHAIGNHSWSHPRFNDITMEEARKQINDTQQKLEEIAGVRPSLFRPPYGALDEEKEELVYEMKLAIVNWSVDTMDWSGLSAPDILELVREQIWPGGIILQHSSGGKDHELSNTIEALKQIIPELSEQGYSFVTVPELLHLSDSQPQ
ncbi:N-acetylmuramoyl-L-alanine amidase [Paenibacillus arenilitoris]|uniref:N-acetylmuramoyl-L-alanine amidase n=1 Tax=Paenibacillus arenilitoris TaxID=2772299 RepID=A0A927CRB2_9BACL|nr:N-acetylmuramoyl-L-alanine amidase [Paenibacillus arenilitoris]MBD2871702.1 N-acetylmuramoyl-L-alanine amidase [Paenibacillus arenilitoris]